MSQNEVFKVRYGNPMQTHKYVIFFPEIKNVCPYWHFPCA